jgi:hypothetical protein
MSGNWRSETLMQALNRRHFLIQEIQNEAAFEEVAASRHQQMVMLCNGAHHVALRRFFQNGPLIFFDSRQQQPVHIEQPDTFWADLKRQGENAFIEMYVINEPSTWTMPFTSPAHRLAARPVGFREQLITFVQNQTINLENAPISSSDPSQASNASQYVPPPRSSFGYPVPAPRTLRSKSAPVQAPMPVLTRSERLHQEVLRSSSQERPLTRMDEQAARFNFGAQLDAFNVQICAHCQEGHLLKSHNGVTEFVCKRCKSKTLAAERNYFSSEFANPGLAPDSLPQLSIVEQQLISLVHVNQYVYIRGQGATATKGHCINFAQDLTVIARELPRLAQDVGIVVVRKIGSDNRVTDLRVRRHRVQAWLEWLKANSRAPGYRDLVINNSNLQLLPEDDFVQLTTVETEDDLDLNSHRPVSDQNEQAAAHAPNQQEPSLCAQTSQASQHSITCAQVESLSQRLDSINIEQENDDSEETTHTAVVCDPGRGLQETEHVEEIVNGLLRPPPVIQAPTHNPLEPLSEYNTPYLATYAFPCLFPYGRGDPFGLGGPNMSQITLNQHLHHLIQFCVVKDSGERVFPFQDSRFVLWSNNLKYRHMMNEQGTVYLRKTPGDANLTIDQLKELLNQPMSRNSVLQRMCRYMANIPGTPSYWVDASKDLEAIVHNKGPPHAFFTLTYPDLHEPYLLELLQLPPESSKAAIKKKISENPGLAEKYFVFKWEVFADLYLVGHLRCDPAHGGWYWCRFEWQHRGGIHVHGLYRLPDSQPDPYVLSDIAIKGFEVKQKLLPKSHLDQEWTADEINDMLVECSEEHRKLIKDGEEAEERIIRFNDSLVVADISIPEKEYVRPVWNRECPIPMSMRPTDELIDNDQVADLDNLAMVCCRHICREGACRKWKMLDRVRVLTPCRFKYPKRLIPRTKLSFCKRVTRDGHPCPTEMSILLKRVNSPNITPHVPEHLRVWRGNMDTSVCHDLRRVLMYVTKYATKPESKSNPCRLAYKEVLLKATNENTNTVTALRHTMQRVLANRDITVFESVHGLLSMPLHMSNLIVVNVSLSASEAIQADEHTHLVTFRNSLMTTYAKRNEYIWQKTSDLQRQVMDMNLMEFGTRFSARPSKVRSCQRFVLKPYTVKQFF